MCLLREFIARRGGLTDFAALLSFIETRGKDADILSVRRATSLVCDYIHIGIMARSRQFFAEVETAARVIVPKAEVPPERRRDG